MSISEIIAACGIAVSAFVAFSVAYLHRRQMRQVELYKQDPTVGLIPPPTVLGSFVKSKWDKILAFGGPVLSLFLEFSSNSPLTRWSVLLISVNVALLVSNIVLLLVFRSVNRVLSVVSRLIDSLHKQFDISMDQREINAIQAKILERITEKFLGNDGK